MTMSRSGLDIARCAADDLRGATVGASATARRNSAAPTTATVSADCIVVGAGVVGCALAYRLAEDGRSVVLLERDLREPDRIVGELLQPGGVRALTELGLRSCLDGIDAVPVHGYGVFNGEQVVELPYPSDEDSVDEDADGKRAMGMSFHHGKFIMSLRAKCLGHPRITVVEANASALICDDETNGKGVAAVSTSTTTTDDHVRGVLATVKSTTPPSAMETAFTAPLTFLVDGCFSKFRKEIPHKDVLVRSHFAGVVLEDCPLPMPNHGHVVLADPSPILLYQIGTRDTRILVDVPGKVPSASSGALKHYMLEKVGPQLPEAVRPCFEKAIESQRIRMMPNCHLPAAANTRRGVVVLGDALNMRHPLTGGGMTVGLWDALTITRLLHPTNIPDLNSTSSIIAQLHTFHRVRKSHSGVINILAQALYELFSAGDDADMQVLRDACFAYFCLGGVHVRHPVGLLAGLIQSPLTLLVHFFAVAFLGMFRLLFLTPLALLQPLLMPASTLAAAQSRSTPLYATLKASDVVLRTTAVAASMPVNAARGVKVILSAATVIFPLIWAELKLQSV